MPDLEGQYRPDRTYGQNGRTTGGSGPDRTVRSKTTLLPNLGNSDWKSSGGAPGLALSFSWWTGSRPAVKTAISSFPGASAVALAADISCVRGGILRSLSD